MSLDIIAARDPSSTIIFVRASKKPEKALTTRISSWRNTESRVFERISDLVTSDNMFERVLGYAQRRCEIDLEPERNKLALARTALRENQAQADHMMATIATGALMEMLNERATQFKIQREQLKIGNDC